MKGVDKSRKNLRVEFTFKGKRMREPLHIPNSPSNILYASRIVKEVKEEIKLDCFNWKKHFPKSKNAVFYGETEAVFVTIEKLLIEWIAFTAPSLKASTLSGYNSIIHNELIPAFGDLTVNEFKLKHAKRWAPNKTCSAKRISNIISPLRQALEHAVEDELIKSNPLHHWTYKKRTGRKNSAVDPFTKEEQQAILSALKGQYKNLVQFWFWTGLRTSELVALTWTDIDWLNGTVEINKALTMAADEPEEPKTKAGNRFVKLHAPALEALTNQKQHTFMLNDTIFHDLLTNEQWQGSSPIRKRLWIPALKRAGVRYRYPYQCRHTFASMMLSSGENLMWVAKQIGHSSAKQTLDAYARHIQSADHSEGQSALAKYWNAPLFPQAKGIQHV